GADVLDGGAGVDLADYSDAASGVTADLQDAAANTGFAAGDSYVSIENLYGSRFDDDLRGDGEANTIQGWDGNDTIHGRDGNDQLGGGAGDDTVFGDAGSDQIWGGGGNDELYGGDGHDVLRGEAGWDQIW